MSTELAERIAAVVLAHPAVSALNAGPFGTVASYLPGRRVDGVRVADDGSAVEVSVTLVFGQPIPVVADQLRSAVRGLTGDVAVNVTIVDLVQRDLGQGDLVQRDLEQVEQTLEDSR
ncbi:MAG TPA: hypothetical protein VFM37_01580 [Pseudonocardiaceae bacterium]|nr:hypothetical protein [Pseudonocardiaceae bacterium]